MRALAAFLVASRSQAILAAAGFALLSFLLPPSAYLAGGAVGLVTLMQGGAAGLMVAVGALAAAGALAVWLLGSMAPVAVFALVLWLPVWLVAQVLRRSVSLPLALQSTGALGLGVLLGFHLAVGDPAAWWYAQLESIRPVFERMGWAESGVDLDRVLREAARVMTGAAAGAMVLGTTVSLLIARGWQALLVNPGGLGREFAALRLGQGAGWLAIAVLVVALLPGIGGTAAVELGFILLVLFLFQGLAVAHGVRRAKKANIGWLFGLYMSLALLPPQTGVLLALLGLMDTWMDFRSRVSARDGESDSR